jgi:hypothetical protein
MYTHGCVTWHALVSQLVVIIHYETISMCYLSTICFCYMRFIIGASSVMVSWLRTYGRSETESPLWMYTQGYVAWRMLVSRSLVMIYYGITLMCYLPWTFPWNNFYVVYQVIKQHISSLLGQKGIPLPMYGLFSLTSMVTSHIHVPFASFLVKVKPWSFLVLEDSWLALKMEICFPCC